MGDSTEETNTGIATRETHLKEARTYAASAFWYFLVILLFAFVLRHDLARWNDEITSFDRWGPMTLLYAFAAVCLGLWVCFSGVGFVLAALYACWHAIRAVLLWSEPDEKEQAMRSIDKEDWSAAASRLHAIRPMAETGDAEAQNILGMLYTGGYGVPQDYAEALKWFELAAAQGDLAAQGYLGILYAEGETVPQDYAKAREWYGLAATQGSPHHQMELGNLYENGQGGPVDYVEAHRWYNLAASRESDPEAQAQAINRRDEVADKMTPAQIAAAQKLAREWDEAHPR